MRSIRSELYLFIKTAIMGGTYNNDVEEKDYIFEKVPKINTFEFFNSQILNQETIDAYQLNAVFFEYASPELFTTQNKTSETNVRANTKDTIQIRLHLITGKVTAEMGDKDYLDALDLGEKIFQAIENKKFLGIQPIHKITEDFDTNSSTIMDYTLVFETTVTNCGEGDTIDVREDPEPKEIPFEVGVKIENPKPYIE